MKQMSDIEQMITIIKKNIELNPHWYQCAFLQEDGECDCDNFTDEEIAIIVMESYGYKLIKDNNEQQRKFFI